VQCLGQGTRLRVDREALLELVEPVAALVDHTLVVRHHDVFAPDAEAHIVLCSRYCGRAGAGEHDLDLVEIFFHQLERVEQRGAGNDRGAVLVIVKYRNAERVA